MTEQSSEERAAAFIDAWRRAADGMEASLKEIGRAAALACAAFGRVAEEDPRDRALQAKQRRGSGPPPRRLDGRPSR